jgi:thioester reductase-like protein
MSETIFLTGATGFIGGYVVVDLLTRDPDVQVLALTRAKNTREAYERLWASLQLHWDEATFRRFAPRITPVLGDLHAPDLGLSKADQKLVMTKATSILHIAASLNRKSAKACLNTNLRGTLSVLKYARALADEDRLRRYSHVSTVAVAGHRSNEVVQEDDGIDWNRSDYDPYGRTKKFCEHMARELLPDVEKTFFRPSIVMGDSRMEKTSQFDMVRAFCFFADLPLIPLRPDDRLDIVNANWVSEAIAVLHLKDKPRHDIYHLSSGTAAETCRITSQAMAETIGRKARFAPWLFPTFKASADALARSSQKNAVTAVGSLVSVFLPYIAWNTVFDNSRAVAELGHAPVPFSQYCGPLYTWSKKADFKFATVPLGPAPLDNAAGATTPAATSGADRAPRDGADRALRDGAVTA